MLAAREIAPEPDKENVSRRVLVAGLTRLRRSPLGRSSASAAHSALAGQEQPLVLCDRVLEGGQLGRGQDVSAREVF